MLRSRAALVACVAALAAVACDGSKSSGPVAAPEPRLLKEPPVGAVLIPGLTNRSFAVTTRHPDVQRWFDQGLMLAFGFNHDGAERSFLKATELDPDCAMCWWGAALVLGPHVNAAMDPARNPHAWDRIGRARARAARASERERALIEALAARYAANPPPDRRPLDAAYAAAMGRVVAQRPDDLDAAVLYAEALMDQQPWDYYDAALQPKGRTREIVATLESVIARAPDHAGALHLYVHAVEASATPERGVAAADRLRTLVPGSGHLVHMPAHIYARVGRWHDAVIANQVAIAADDGTIALCGPNLRGVYPLGYVPHNHHFLWFAASMEGASEIARRAAAETSRRTNLPQQMREPAFAVLQHFWMTPWFERVRFGRWDEIRGLPNPAPDLPYVTAIWHFAQGMAAVRQDRRPEAERHHVALAALVDDPVLTKLTAWDRYPLSLGARIAERTLAAEIAAAARDLPRAIAALEEAARIEDEIPYDEPPAWHAPVRHTLGAFLLDAGRAREAEAVYRAELARNPANGWSLHGLERSLRAQRRNDEARVVARAFEDAWRHADVKLSASRL
jgi:tetratricopeptide (TPR) repeat protein